MINQTEQEEREYLGEVLEKLLLAVNRVDESVKQYSRELKQNKAYIHEHQSGLDEADLVAAEQSINRMATTGEGAVARRRKLIKLTQSPYFARIDFSIEQAVSTVYIGIYTFFDETDKKNIVYDWRAPVSSIFYDFELGPASYQTPSGRIDVQLLLKRQYRIRDGQMEFMIENSINIQDDVLQKELSRASDEKMKNIVATIQRDQNAVIRNETSQVLIIQGVAGSGKTSIALHRIAFLLYRFRDTIASKDILIISPNKVFADYISSVLPELGEEHIPEMGIEELASEVLDHKVSFQTFFEQVAALLDQHEADFIERMKFKSTFEFLGKLNQYLIHVENNFIEFTEFKVGKVVVPFPFIQEKFRAYHRVPFLKRAHEVAKDIQHFVRDQVKRKLTGHERAHIWEALPKMLRLKNTFEIYKNFYQWNKRPEMFVLKGEKLEYADVFPLIYCKIRLEGFQAYDHIKHLLVDEMQDYTPVQYAVLSRLFKCRKTILGDASQKVNPYSASSLEEIQQVFPQADTIKLFRSYRSTLEIVKFSQAIIPNPDIIPMERHGHEPALIPCADNREELQKMREFIIAFEKSGLRSMGILAKTQEQASFIFHELRLENLHLLTPESSTFKDGVIITTAHLSKGLEFDSVVVPFVSSRNYSTDVDQRMLYIACTRAMHELRLLYSKEPSKFLTMI